MTDLPSNFKINDEAGKSLYTGLSNQVQTLNPSESEFRRYSQTYRIFVLHHFLKNGTTDERLNTRSSKSLKICVYRTINQVICFFFLLNSFYSRIVLIPKAEITVNSGDTAVPTAYQNPTAIRFLRINPRSWYEESALRLEIYGCVLPKISTEGMGAIVLNMQKNYKDWT